MKALLFFALLIISVFAPMTPYFEKGLRVESSLPPAPSDETVKRAMMKSILWANDDQIRRLVQRAEVKYGRQIDLISQEHDISSEDIKAIAIVESLIAEKARSGDGAIGLMGIKRGTGRDMGFNRIDHPVENLKAGAEYYRRLLNRYKDRELALAAYNLGPAKLEKKLGNGFDPETMSYIWKIRRVLNIMARSDSGTTVSDPSPAFFHSRQNP